MNITKGEFEFVKKHESNGLENEAIGGSVEQVLGGLEVAAVWGDVKEWRDNGKVMAEALTIANQTGLSPKQLLEQRDELLKKLNEIVLIEGDYAEWNGINDATLHEIKDLIKSIK